MKEYTELEIFRDYCEYLDIFDNPAMPVTRWDLAAYTVGRFGAMTETHFMIINEMYMKRIIKA